MKTLRQTINDIKKLFPFAEEYKLKVQKINGSDNSISGFIKFCDEKYLYISTFDIRVKPQYRQQILFRAARNYKDFTGGINHFFDIDKIGLTGENINKYIFCEW